MVQRDNRPGSNGRGLTLAVFVHACVSEVSPCKTARRRRKRAICDRGADKARGLVVKRSEGIGLSVPSSVQ